MSKTQRNVLAILLAGAFLELAISRRFVMLWNHAFKGK